MANTFQIKRGTTIPPDGALADGELGYNKTNGSLYIGVSSKNDDDTTSLKSLPAFFLEKLTPNLTSETNDNNETKYYIYKGNIASSSTDISQGTNYWLKKGKKSFLILTIGVNIKTSSTWSGTTLYNNFVIPLKDTGLTHCCSFSANDDNNDNNDNNDKLFKGEIKIRTQGNYIGCTGIKLYLNNSTINLATTKDSSATVYRFELKAYAI